MTNRLLHFVAFGCLGITTEIFFTAFSNLYNQASAGQAIDLSMAGHSYVWMFFVYGFAAVLFPVFFPWVSKYPLVVRLLIYMVSIFVVEYLAGWLLQATTGSCPWHYDTPWAIHGYIRLDYGLFWFVFGYVLERVFVVLDSIAPVIDRDRSPG